MGKEPAPMRPNIQKNDIVFVCEKENKIIAFAILVIKDGNIFLYNVVSPAVLCYRKGAFAPETSPGPMPIISSITLPEAIAEIRRTSF